MSAAPRNPTPAEIRRWRQYLADERAEAAVYEELASKRSGEERAILLGLVEAERRHEAHWVTLLGENVGLPTRTKMRTRMLAFLARRFGSIFVLALMQQAEARSPYGTDDDATDAMAADEQIHEEVVRGLAARGRTRLSGTFRAAVFGANDGLVSNLALVIGMAATGVSNSIVLAAGIAGLLAGALSMGAGEFVSVRSQRELLSSTLPNPETTKVLPNLDAEANELALVYRARGMTEEDAESHARERLYGLECIHGEDDTARRTPGDDGHSAIGSAWSAAASSFCFFSSGAIIPVIPLFFGATGLVAIIISAILVGIALLMTGAIVGVLSGASPWKRALRQLGIGYGAALVTYLLGLLFGTSVG
ncbi:VIT1/CCC1 family protein [Microbacterium sp. MPKO10]|uniref:VIT1/CCC1 transporter family protein n=1 Tax=Microbacterium sp. MPKO10 TaxID=2989818 RepID=UPI00223550CA|nr:VIT1/CCC1 family protein [Microbacterium sp. MPKO10]MCW4456775.1 VIT1/CCC1 family protein [Microbacterium sp. MPKO10]